MIIFNTWENKIHVPNHKPHKMAKDLLMFMINLHKICVQNFECFWHIDAWLLCNYSCSCVEILDMIVRLWPVSTQATSLNWKPAARKKNMISRPLRAEASNLQASNVLPFTHVCAGFGVTLSFCCLNNTTILLPKCCILVTSVPYAGKNPHDLIVAWIIMLPVPHPRL